MYNKKSIPFFLALIAFTLSTLLPISLQVQALGTVNITNNTPGVYAAICIDGLDTGVVIAPGDSASIPNLAPGNRNFAIVDPGIPGFTSTPGVEQVSTFPLGVLSLGYLAFFPL